MKYKTDKEWKHGFIDFYDSIFFKLRNKKINILELGILNGDSIEYLIDYFPNAHIYAIDIDDKKFLKFDRTKIFQLDCSDEFAMNSFFKKLDIKFSIILDDASHKMFDQQIALKILFNYLSSEGIFIIEDLQTSLPHYSDFDYGKNAQRTNTTLGMINYFIGTGILRSEYFDNNIGIEIASEIDHVRVFNKNNNLHSISAAIFKK